MTFVIEPLRLFNLEKTEIFAQISIFFIGDKDRDNHFYKLINLFVDFSCNDLEGYELLRDIAEKLKVIDEIKIPDEKELKKVLGRILNMDYRYEFQRYSHEIAIKDAEEYVLKVYDIKEKIVKEKDNNAKKFMLQEFISGFIFIYQYYGMLPEYKKHYKNKVVILQREIFRLGVGADVFKITKK